MFDCLEYLKGIECKGNMCVPEAYVIVIKEQGWKTLHAHILVLIKKSNIFQTDLYDQDSNIRDKAIKKHH